MNPIILFLSTITFSIILSVISVLLILYLYIKPTIAQEISAEIGPTGPPGPTGPAGPPGKNIPSPFYTIDNNTKFEIGNTPYYVDTTNGKLVVNSICIGNTCIDSSNVKKLNLN